MESIDKFADDLQELIVEDSRRVGFQSKFVG